MKQRYDKDSCTMIISPPFLPESGLWSDDASRTDPMMDVVDGFECVHGIYPIAHDRDWHCGVHLAPDIGGPVHAIADGEVIAYRVCQHAIASGQGNAGFVLLKHSTETGHGRALTFYSLYMHLLALSEYHELGFDDKGMAGFLRLPSGPNVKGGVTSAAPGSGEKVRRKDVLGYLGRYQGVGYLHFEIFMTPPDFEAYFDGTQVANLTPSAPVVAESWGHTYHLIPEGQQFRSTPPGTDARGKLNGLHIEPGVNGTTPVPLVVETYFNKGSKYTNVWKIEADGSRTLTTPAPVRHRDYEYELYRRATALYDACPSDGLDLLRFGRITSPQATLIDATLTNWASVTYDEATMGYVNMNSPLIATRSDADFPWFMGWQTIDNQNAPFDEAGLFEMDALKALVKDSSNYWERLDEDEPEKKRKALELAHYITLQDSTRQRLRGFICHAPSEWDSTHNQTRYGRLLDEGDFYDGNIDGYHEFLVYLDSLQFWGATGLPAGQKLWFFHPLSFIRHFRRCGWLTEAELAATFPRHLFYTQSGSPRKAITTDNDTYSLTISAARDRIRNFVTPLNKCLQKYMGSNPQRIALFLAQTLWETAQWRHLGGTKRRLHEWGFGKYSAANPATQYYGPFYGRGIMQLTWAGNYNTYGVYRSIPNNDMRTYIERLTSTPPRLTDISQHYSVNPNDGGKLMQWYPRYDPDQIAEDFDLACDSGGFYWVSKSFSRGTNINRVCDERYSIQSVGFINRLVNGGANGYYERQAYSRYILNVLNDEVIPPGTSTITLPTPRASVIVSMRAPE
ncbi:M23 family metallopeptidase [Burkholderia sp. Ac-20379]|uniref:M23 family metallopeptidase n=1 Tax=Burkholderia sp. Ac-20379 TaxID=2703900 RepID=UPI0019824C24|nr:M23 family metallopeptidase [Burkholderia sp. Ac-20379]MBN3722775.1 peptidase M23 [Burkholderia sp. Ac-20379]